VVGFTSEQLKADKASRTSKQMELVRRNWCQNQWAGTLYTSNKHKEIISGNKDQKIGQSYTHCISIVWMNVATPADKI